MKKLTFLPTQFLIGLLLPLISFSQISYDEFSLEPENSFVPSFDSFIIQNKFKVASQRGTSDRLIAQRHDFSYDFDLTEFDQFESKNYLNFVILAFLWIILIVFFLNK